MKIGIGYDVHRLVENRQLILGGVKIPYKKGLLGHSDADVLVHALMDAIIGALGQGDIGKHFPDNDKAYSGIDSMILLNKIYELMNKDGYEIGNIDATIVAQKPKMAPYLEEMKNKISKVLKISTKSINIKATTEEGLGFTGRQEGISSHVVVLLMPKK